MKEKHFLATAINELFDYIVGLPVAEVDKIAIDINYETYDLLNGMLETKNKETKRRVVEKDLGQILFALEAKETNVHRARQAILNLKVKGICPKMNHFDTTDKHDVEWFKGCPDCKGTLYIEKTLKEWWG